MRLAVKANRIFFHVLNCIPPCSQARRKNRSSLLGEIRNLSKSHYSLCSPRSPKSIATASFRFAQPLNLINADVNIQSRYILLFTEDSAHELRGHLRGERGAVVIYCGAPCYWEG